MPPTHERPGIIKVPVDPNRIRHMPPQFAPLDRRLVYDRLIGRLTHPQVALYVFLQCVADAAGLSYYSDQRICDTLHFTASELRDARQGLIQHQFLLYRKPMYQCLDLPQPVSVASAAPRPPPPERQGDGDAVSFSTVVSDLCTRAFQP